MKSGDVNKDKLNLELEKLDADIRALIESDPLMSTVEDAIGIINVDLALDPDFQKSVNPYIKMTLKQQNDTFDGLFSLESIKRFAEKH